MNAVSTISFVVVSLPFLSWWVRPTPTATVPRPGLLLVIPVCFDPPECKCGATTGDSPGHNDSTISCSGGPEGCSQPTIFISNPEKADATCKVVDDPTSCADDGKKCTATVVAELQWPSNPCCSTLAVTGPGIGTTQNPCQTATAPNNVEVTWELEAPCKKGAAAETDDGDELFKVYSASCDGGQPPGSGLQVDYAPRLTCAICTRTQPPQ